LQDRHAGPQVIFHGHTALRKVLAATAKADVVVVPSVWEEPCGTVILEALRLGRSCYALRRGGTPELARYGRPGQLVLFDDMTELVRALVVHVPFDAQSDPGESASTFARLPELLAIYADGVRGR